MSLSVVCMPLGVDDSETISCTILPSNIRDVILLAAYRCFIWRSLNCVNEFFELKSAAFSRGKTSGWTQEIINAHRMNFNWQASGRMLARFPAVVDPLPNVWVVIF